MKNSSVYGKEPIIGECFFYLKRIALVVISVFLLSCSMPKIVVYEDPLTPEEHINLGVVYEKKEKYKEALREYRIASKELPIGYFYMGNACFKMGDYNCAESNYRKALRRIPENPALLNNLAWLYYTLGKRLSEAEALAEKAVKMNPENAAYQDTLNKIRQLIKQKESEQP